jgi:hypothetical protein
MRPDKLLATSDGRRSGKPNPLRKSLPSMADRPEMAFFLESALFQMLLDYFVDSKKTGLIWLKPKWNLNSATQEIPIVYLDFLLIINHIRGKYWNGIALARSV